MQNGQQQNNKRQKSKILVPLILLVLLFAALAASACSSVIVTVTFEPNGGSTVISQTLSRGSKATKPPAPTKTGHAFAGWYADSALSDKYNFSQKVRGNITLYAAWTANCYTITFVTAGSAIAPLAAEFGSQPELPKSQLSGFVFDDWYTSAEKTKRFDGVMPASDITLYAVFLDDKDYEAFSFEKNLTGYTLTLVKDIKLDEITVPATFDNKKVNKIGKGAFSKARQIQSVVLPDSVTEIADSAFEGMNSLTKITLPNIAAIAPRQFYGCEKLSEIILPQTVKNIGINAFYGCKSLLNLILPSGLEQIGSRAFYASGIKEIEIPPLVSVLETELFFGAVALFSVTFSPATSPAATSAQTTSAQVTVAQATTPVDIPARSLEIKDGAFEGCIKLQQITLPAGTSAIGARAFASSGLTEITLPQSVTKAGEYLFYDCDDLTRAEFLGEDTKAGDYMFYGCGRLNSISLPAKLKQLPTGIFEGCTALVQINLPATIEQIGSFAFRGCTRLSTVNLPRVNVIPTGIFEGCTSLQQLDIPTSVTEIGNSAFYGCNALSQIDLPEGLVSIGGSAFYGCGLLDEFSFADELIKIGSQAFFGTAWQSAQSGDIYAGSVLYLAAVGQTVLRGGTKAIADYAFAANRSITAIVLTGTLQYIGAGAFEGCALESIVLPASLKEIGTNAFLQCKQLTSVTFEGDSVRAIGSGAFSGCDDLAEIDLPQTDSLGIGVFSGCSSLTRVTLPTNLSSIPNMLFFACVSLESIEIPDGVKVIGRGAFMNANSLKRVEFLPHSQLGTIEPNAFEGCNALAGIDLPPSVTDIMSYAFRYSGLSRITIGENVLAIGDEAFFRSSAAAGLTVLLEGNPTLGMNTFNVSAGLKIIMPNDFYQAIKTEIFADVMFENWKTYKSVVFSFDMAQDGFVLDGDRLVAYIGDQSHLQIPETVSIISAFAFYGLEFVTTVDIPPAVCMIGDYAFFGTGLTAITINDGVTAIGAKAFYVKGYLTRINVVIENIYLSNIAQLGAGAFRVRGYHKTSYLGADYYMFEDDPAVYDERCEVVEAGEELQELFEQMSATAFTRGIIKLSNSLMVLSYRLDWQEYAAFITYS